MQEIKPSIINFEKIEVPENLAKTRVQVVNIKEAFADAIYQRGTGIACHSLALKIYNSDGATEYNEREVQLISTLAQSIVTPAVMDGITEAIKRGQTPQTK